MAITIISSPSLVNTAINPNVWVIESNNKNLPGFRYIVTIKDSITNNVLKTIEVSPRPGDAYGEFNISKTLSTYIKNDIDMNSLYVNNYSLLSNWKLRYKLVIGEQYFTNWQYSDTEWVNMTETKLVQSSPTTNPFQIGDNIIVTPNNQNIRPGFGGIYNIIGLSAVGGFPIVNAPWVNTPLNPGYIKFADNRLTRYDSLLTTTDYEVLNGVIDFDKWPSTNFTNYKLENVNKKFYTNWESNFEIEYGQDIFVPVLPLVNAGIKVEFTRDDSSVFSYIISSNANLKQTKMINITPRNSITGGFLYNTNIKYYDVQLKNSTTNVVLSEKMRIVVNSKCKVSDIEILFEDRKGAYSSFAFSAQSNYDLKITKETYNKNIEFTGSTYNPINVAGTTIINIDYEKEFTIRTKTITNRKQDLYFEELLLSDNTYIKINGNYQRVDILEQGGNFKSLSQTGLRRREIKIKMANKI